MCQRFSFRSRLHSSEAMNYRFVNLLLHDASSMPLIECSTKESSKCNLGRKSLCTIGYLLKTRFGRAVISEGMWGVFPSTLILSKNAGAHLMWFIRQASLLICSFAMRSNSPNRFAWRSVRTHRSSVRLCLWFALARHPRDSELWSYHDA
jgi:hypothetical protein